MHAVGPPKFNIISIMMRLFDCALMFWIPCADTIIHALLHHREYFFQPFVVPTYPPFAIHFHNASHLTVCCCVKLMRGRFYRQYRPEILMSFLILAFTKFSVTQCPF